MPRLLNLRAIASHRAKVIARDESRICTAQSTPKPASDTVRAEHQTDTVAYGVCHAHTQDGAIKPKPGGKRAASPDAFAKIGKIELGEDDLKHVSGGLKIPGID